MCRGITLSGKSVLGSELGSGNLGKIAANARDYPGARRRDNRSAPVAMTIAMVPVADLAMMPVMPVMPVVMPTVMPIAMPVAQAHMHTADMNADIIGRRRRGEH